MREGSDMKEPLWTKGEEEILINNLGKMSYGAIGKKVGKTAKAVRQKKVRMGLGDPKNALDYITVDYLSKNIGTNAYIIRRWGKENGLKITHNIIAYKQRVSRIKITDFWEWAEKNQELINWRGFENGNLGIEPEWTKEARKKYTRTRIQWNAEKERLLESYVNIGLSWEQIAENFKGTKNAVRTKYNYIIRERIKNKKKINIF